MTDTPTLDIDAARERLRVALRPHVALVGLTTHLMQFQGLGVEEHIAISDRVPHADTAGPAQEAWSAANVRLITALDADPEIRALRQRLYDAGFASGFSGDSDDAGIWPILLVHGPRFALPRLEELAAADAGITDAAERAAASDRFLTYMLRNHHPDWQANRAKHADVGDSPYTPPEERRLLDT